MQKFSSHTCSELARALVLTRFGASVRHERRADSQQKRSWRNSVWHSVQISVTIDVKERSKNEYHFRFST
jgi:hypothetical protein